MQSQTNQSKVENVFFSMSMRFIVPIEHANMIGTIAESNITKHRFIHIPVSMKAQDGEVKYRLVKVPAISGQAVLNAYERALVDYAEKVGLPVDSVCEQYNFIKHTNDNKGNEQDWINNCVVEDITGYLAPQVGIRKTSAIWFSYVVPDLTAGKALLDYQMFTRFTPEAKKGEQFIGERESGHAVYRLSVAINVNAIGRDGKGNLVINNAEERRKRIEAAFRALMLIFDGGYIGANKTRALMIEYTKPASFAAAVSVGLPFMVSPAEDYDYIENTCQRAKAFVNELGSEVHLFYSAGTDAKEPQQCNQGNKLTSNPVSTLNEAIKNALDKVLEKLGLKEQGSTA